MSRLPKTSKSYREILATFPAGKATPLPLGAKWAGPVPLSHGHMVDLVTEAREDRARHLRIAFAKAARLAAAPFVAAAKSWRVHQRDREELAQLDDRSLRDMGISRYDAIMACRSQFRRD
ncbi:MAG: DUF1127 domain-containing protein [Alphaproteobacteria bacterium]